jgi:hypothetical protein
MFFQFFENQQYRQRNTQKLFFQTLQRMPPKIFTKFVIRGKCPLQKLVPNFAIAKVSSEKVLVFLQPTWLGTILL